MLPIKKLVLIILICLPATGWCTNLKYALDVDINTADSKITGYARLTSDTDLHIRLSVVNLQQLKIDADAITTGSDKTIDLTIQKGKAVVISYEVLFGDKQTNIIEQSHVFLTENWYPQPHALAEYALSVTLPKGFIAVSESEAATVQNHDKTKTFHFRFRLIAVGSP